MNKKSLFVLTVIFLLSICSFAQKEWTVMVFLNGDNNLEGAAVKDVNEMEIVGSTKNVDILVQFDRASGYDKSNGDWTDTKIFHIKKDRNTKKITSPVVKELGEVDMGSYEEAIKFFNWSVKNYPAKRYLFVYWNHGAGWLKENKEPGLVKGISYDDESGNHIDSVGMRKVAQAMYSTLGRKMDIVAFDACLMGMAEVAYQHSEYVDYMIASEEVEPGDGWPYTPILKALKKNPTMGTDSFGKVIVNEYIKSYKNGGWYGPRSITQACLDLSNTEKMVNAVNDFSSEIYKNIQTEKSVLDHAMNYAQKYEYPFYKDLYHFAELVSQKTENKKLKELSDKVMKSVEEMVVLSRYQNDNMKNSYGVAIYAPRENEYKSHYKYTQFAKDTSWDEMLNKYYNTTVNNVYTENTTESSNGEVDFSALFEEADNAFSGVSSSEEEQEETDILNEDGSIDWSIIDSVLNSTSQSFERNDELMKERMDKIDALASNVAQTIILEMESGNSSSYKELIKLVSQDSKYAIILEKID